MAHSRAGHKLSRSSAHRRALLRNLMTELFRHERIRTTDTKARAIRASSERIITLARRGDLSARRLIMRDIHDRAVVDKLIHVIGPDLADRPGGYTRVIKLGARAGDAAPMVYLELVD
jgi:large subunit ribosomal protein L17